MRWAGVLGFGISEHNPQTGKSRVSIQERQYYGLVLENSRSWRSDDQINDDLVLSNRLSILIDEYAIENQDKIKYASFNGTYWKVTRIGIDYPRMTLTLGGVYNGVKA